MSEDRCICCGAIIPEGVNVCPSCLLRVSKKKIKTHFAKIIVDGTAEKPYYNILYYDPAWKEYVIGYGSYNLAYVFKWLKEEFEIDEQPKGCKYCKDEFCVKEGIRWLRRMRFLLSWKHRLQRSKR